MTGSHGVTFNGAQKDLYLSLKKKGAISSEFTDFVKQAFHEKIDSINRELLKQKSEE